jgi:acyl-CoA reductase-like NAD-dependent aldehyde dehydrogenase
MTKYLEKLTTVAGKLFINGELVSSQGGNLFDVLNPATEEPIGQAVAGTSADVDLAVQSARTAFNGVWRQTDAHSRGKMLYKLADLIEANAEWLTHYETLNNGKPISVSTA